MTSSSTDPAPEKPRRRILLPRWAKITLAIILGLVVLALIFGDPEEVEGDASGAVLDESLVTTQPSTSEPPRNAYTVVSVIEADVVELWQVHNGTNLVVRILGMDVPSATDGGNGAECYGAESVSWARETLEGTAVTFHSDQPAELDHQGRTFGYLTLHGGRDYSTMAAFNGFARFAANAVGGALASDIRQAEREARSAKVGLWGPPCHGATEIKKSKPPAPPKPVPQPQPEPPAPEPEPPAAPPAPPAPAVEPDPGGAAFYENCDAVRAAGKDPLLAGEPGYSGKLDRDGDGVACE